MSTFDDDKSIFDRDFFNDRDVRDLFFRRNKFTVVNQCQRIWYTSSIILIEISTDEKSTNERITELFDDTKKNQNEDDEVRRNEFDYINYITIFHY